MPQLGRAGWPAATSLALSGIRNGLFLLVEESSQGPEPRLAGVTSPRDTESTPSDGQGAQVGRDGVKICL